MRGVVPVAQREGMGDSEPITVYFKVGTNVQIHDLEFDECKVEEERAHGISVRIVGKCLVPSHDGLEAWFKTHRIEGGFTGRIWAAQAEE
jgi:hypothetical protein